MQIRTFEIQNFKGLQEIRLEDCGPINAIVGKNNSGKSSVLHALDMAGLALSVNNWNQFQPKIEIKDLFADVGAFRLSINYSDESTVHISANPKFGPTIEPKANETQKFKTLLLLPEAGAGLLQRAHKTPHDILQRVQNREFGAVNALDILFAIKFFGARTERGFTAETYRTIVAEIKQYFPDIEELDCDRTEQDIATLKYEEYGQCLDILYSGSGLKHFLDVLIKTTITGATVVLLDEPESGLHPDLQRRFVGYLTRVASEKQIQFFLATHSQVILNYADTVTYYRVTNSKGVRRLSCVSKSAITTLLDDLGLRPSDVLNFDICVLVEGASDVIFLEHVIRILYADEFKGIAVAVVQYAGSAAEGITSGDIDIANIIPVQRFTFWLRDRDNKPDQPPATNSTKFVNALTKKGVEAYIWKKREIEFYYPEAVHVAAQRGDGTKEESVRSILNGAQDQKFRVAAKSQGVCVPTGNYLRSLLKEHLTKRTQLDAEIREIVENRLLSWKQSILGLSETS